MIIAVFIATMLIGIGIRSAHRHVLLCAVCTALAMGGGDANPPSSPALMQGSDSVTMMALPASLCW